VDVDAHVALRSQDWQRLDALASKRPNNGQEVDELIQLYQQTSGDLSALRTNAPEPVVVNRLSAMLTRVRGLTTSARVRGFDTFQQFFVVTLPVAFYRIRWWTVSVMVAFLIISVVSGVLISTTPGGLDMLGSPEERQHYAESAFEAYYSNQSAPDFTRIVWTNNAFISAQSVAFGVTGIFPVFVLVQNAIGIGGAGAMMAEAGRLDVFFSLILPHGQLELTAVFVAIAAGLRIFWAWVAPGALPRGQALAAEGRRLIVVSLGLVLVLGLSGVIEGFVPRSALPTAIQLAIGALALAVYWVYTLVLGRKAVLAGYTGDLEHRDRGAQQQWAL